MIRNEGNLDRVARVVVAIAALVAGLAIGAGSALGIVALAVAAIMLGTAVAGFCPLYRMFGISSCKLPPATR